MPAHTHQILGKQERVQRLKCGEVSDNPGFVG
jgi:hypothetical protein